MTHSNGEILFDSYAVLQGGHIKKEVILTGFEIRAYHFSFLDKCLKIHFKSQLKEGIIQIIINYATTVQE